jgi:5-methylcytosine-specific restriction endonuclease McrA
MFSEPKLAVSVLDKRPLVPCCEKRARVLLTRCRTVVYRHDPFTICLNDRIGGEVRPVLVKIDPGGKTTAVAVVTDEDGNKQVLCLSEFSHRGRQISEALTARPPFPRRSANLRYRAPRFDNRARAKLAPNLQHRVDTCMSWVGRLRRWAPVSAISVECVRFEIEHSEILGAEYQDGTRGCYEVREYLFEEFGPHRVYCGVSDVPLNLDHIEPRARGGSNRISNIVAAGIPCNTEKDAQPIEEFLAGKPAVLARIKAQARAPLKDAAAINTTRWALYEALADTGLPVEASSGGRAKYNRSRYPEEPRTRRRLRWRSRDARRPAATDARNQGHGTRLSVPDEVGQVRLPADSTRRRVWLRRVGFAGAGLRPDRFPLSPPATVASGGF